MKMKNMQKNTEEERKHKGHKMIALLRGVTPSGKIEYRKFDY